MEKENCGQDVKEYVKVTVQVPEHDQKDKPNVKPWGKIGNSSKNWENEDVGISKKNRKIKNALKLSYTAFPPLEKSDGKGRLKKKYVQ
ncbi:uncharacterized protein LOC111089598 isoform X2 [Limulus polyphemus]|uniref:Uncharacterized protein LOC111089598 isoform X2 n=1 Tax=Limulus polyphemus TaxID=6850 RepID=A0ABM1TQF9_LIMPO|nr:uncharacterized protein LOC111089598 isoform X2 [Limulus polyphemus]